VAFGAEGLNHCPTNESGPPGDEHPSHDAPHTVTQPGEAGFGVRFPT